MLHVGLDPSRKRLDYHALDEGGCTVAVDATPPDAYGVRVLARRFAGRQVRAAIESMNGARFVHDQLELAGWEVEIADAARVKGLAPLAYKTDRTDARVLAELSRRELVPAVWLPDPRCEPSASVLASACTSSATGRVSRTECRPLCSRTASPAPSPTSSTRAAGRCSSACACPLMKDLGTNDPAGSDENEVMETIERSARVSRAG